MIESDAGFALEILGQTGIRYREGDWTLLIDSEALARPAAMALYKSSIRSWQPPHDGETIEDAERSRIIRNVELAFQFNGWQVQVI